MKNKTRTPFLPAALLCSSIPLVIDRFIVPFPDWLAIICASASVILLVTDIYLSRKKQSQEGSS